MSKNSMPDLIDLSSNEEYLTTNPSVEALHSQPNSIETVPCLVPAPPAERVSLDNNPFDSVQKLSERQDDPFEIIEKEACFKARQSTLPPTSEVQVANLLSLSNDNLLDEPVEKEIIIDSNNLKGSQETTFGSSGIESAVSNSLEIESPPISLSNQWTPDSGQSVTDSGEEYSSNCDISAKSKKKALDRRKQLLKLSLSNSTFNSPVSRVKLSEIEGDFTDQNSHSPLTTMFLEAAQCGENMLAFESPLKFVDDEISSEDSPKINDNFEKDFDADLEMLQIPMLRKLPSPIMEEDSMLSFRKENVEPPEIVKEENKGSPIPNLDILRAKLRARREEANNNQDVSMLIKNLKTLICDSEVVDNEKKKQANNLLENLSSALSKNKENENKSTLPVPPAPIVRQGTFDIDLQEKENMEKLECSSVNVHSPSPVKEMPDVMLASSGTYDGETCDDDQFKLIRPKIDPHSPVSTDEQNSSHPDVNDILEQLSKLLEQHQIAQHNVHHGDNSEANNHGVQLGQNPTFIVVMNTTQSSSTASQLSYNNTQLHSLIESPSATKHNLVTRPRSQSLSIHDKVKVVQLQLPTVNVSEHVDNESQLPPVDTLEFKTPSRSMRRNSYSSGTPCTPLITNFSAQARRVLGGSQSVVQNRRASISTQQQSIPPKAIRPLTLPQPKMNTFKPNMRKKIKSSESILKSTGPLKATIPVKKVAPMVTTPPSTVEASNEVNLGKPKQSLLNTSTQFVAKSGKMSYASTPMSKLGAGLPAAFSTPTVGKTPTRSVAANGNKSRYSLMPTTPTLKLPPTEVSSSNLKRRTLAEFGSKSPARTNPSTANKSGITKTSFKPTGNLSKPSNAITNSKMIRRPSVGVSTLNKRNKENKQP